MIHRMFEGHCTNRILLKKDSFRVQWSQPAPPSAFSAAHMPRSFFCRTSRAAFFRAFQYLPPSQSNDDESNEWFAIGRLRPFSGCRWFAPATFQDLLCFPPKKEWGTTLGSSGSCPTPQKMCCWSVFVLIVDET